MAPPKRSSSRASTPLDFLRRSSRAALADPESTGPAPLRRLIKAASAAPESTGTPPAPLRRLTRSASAAPESTETPALPDIPNNITAVNTSRISTPVPATRRSTKAASAAPESIDPLPVTISTAVVSAALEESATAPLPTVPNSNDISISNNGDDETNVMTETAPPPIEGQERLFHAEVNVELTAEPITQIVTDMAAQAKLNIAEAKVAAVDAGADSTIEGDFDWVKLAHRAVAEAEAKAKEAVLELVGPVARRAWIEGRAEDELEKGTPVIRNDGAGYGTEGKGRGVDENGVEDGKIVASVEAEAEPSDEYENSDAAADEEDTAMADADTVSAAQGPLHYEDPDRLLCFCQQPTYGETVYGCDGGNCPYEWYHESCLKRVLYVRHFPKLDEGWLCPYCGEYRVKFAMEAPKNMAEAPKKKRKKSKA